MKVDFRMELTALDSSEIETIRTWRNDYRIWKWTRQNDLISDADQRDWFYRQASDSSVKMYAVKVRVGDYQKLVGVCGLTSLDWPNRRAEFSLYIAPSEQRKGYGRQALRLLLAHAFTNLGLNQVWGETFDQNPAIAIFKELGFRHDGTRRQFYFKDGRFIDAHLVSILREEFNGNSSHSAGASDARREPGDAGPSLCPGGDDPAGGSPAAGGGSGPDTDRAA